MYVLHPSIPPIQNKSVDATRKIVSQSNTSLKKLIWTYFILLIFEGALRKWVLPGLATPLLIIRDPIALWIILLAWKQNKFPSSVYMYVITIITVICIFTSILVGHGNLSVSLFGARIFLLHFPLIFLIGKILNFQDVEKIGKLILYLSIPMMVLVAFQFYSPQSAWVNRGLGGDEKGAGFSGALGFFRPPGTFSFINGLSLFYGLVAAYVIYFWLQKSTLIRRWLLIAATTSLLAVIPLSISRTLIFETGVSIIFLVIVVSRKPKHTGKVIATLFGGVILIFILSNISVFQIATEAMIERLTAANRSEGGVSGTFIDRFLGGFLNPIFNSGELPFWGYGLGMGTNAGAALLTGKRVFLIAEGEWGRLLGEMGLLFGLAVIFLRIHLVIKMSLYSLKALKKENFLPWMLLSFDLLYILTGQWSQPTALGFAVFSGGLVLAALKK